MTSLLYAPILDRLKHGGELPDYCTVYGRVISDIKMSDDVLKISMDDGNRIYLEDTGQSCCERRYMHTDDSFGPFIGAKLLDIEIRDGERDTSDGDCKDSQFLVITTSAGSFTVVNYNEHNGYYGGFSVEARLG
jgi:hypothetical protein